MSKTSVFIISFSSVFVLTSCVSTKKYNHLQHQYTVLHAQKLTEKDDCEMQLNKKETQIQDLLKHIKDLETHIKELKTE